jgi:hypothetical protein
LKACFDVNSHSNVPGRNEENPELWHWVQNQRQLHKKLLLKQLENSNNSKIGQIDIISLTANNSTEKVKKCACPIMQ